MPMGKNETRHQQLSRITVTKALIEIDEIDGVNFF